jgi:hypothetical protein
MAPMVVVDNLDTLSAPDVGSTAARSPDQQEQQQHQQQQQQNPFRPHQGRPTAPPPPPVTTTNSEVVGGTTLSPAIREMVDEFTNGIHAAAPEKLSPTAIETIRKNFEQKKNIFEQFVSFGAQDKAFVPNSEVFTSDWSARADPVAASAGAAVDSTMAITTTSATTVAGGTTTTSAADADTEVGRKGAAGGTSKFPQERNAEGGFKPMIKPLLSPLS